MRLLKLFLFIAILSGCSSLPQSKIITIHGEELIKVETALNLALQAYLNACKRYIGMEKGGPRHKKCLDDGQTYLKEQVLYFLEDK